MNLHNLTSLVGMAGLLLFAWLISADRKRMNRALILWGLALQLVFAVFIFIVPAGASFFLAVNDFVVALLNSAAAGSEFVFGRLALPPGAVNEAGESSLGFILFFQAFPTIIFFSALVAILYYLKLMPALVKAFSWAFTRLMRISGAEALCASSNIFVGVESSLTVKPYLSAMTKSELCTVLTAGMATVASNVLALYVYSLREQFPTIAGHLVSASIMSAPAALVMSKIVYPETGNPKTLGKVVNPHYERDGSLFEAVINGANSGLKLIAGITALLIAALGLVALFDTVIGAGGGWINGATGWSVDWSLKGLLGYVFYPFTLMIGVPVEDAGVISGIIGERVVATEVAGYRHLNAAMGQGLIADPRSAIIATYALCGFAHLASLAIFVGGVSALAPSRTKDIADVGIRALIAATLACLLTACVAGVFLTDNSILLGGS